MYGLGTQRSSVVEFMVKEDGAWKIDSEERLAPKIREGTTAVKIEVDQCAFKFDSDTISSGKVAFVLENVGDQPHHVVLSTAPEGLELTDIAYVNNLEPGGEANLPFTEPLAAGHYAIRCSVPGDLGNSTQAEFKLK